MAGLYLFGSDCYPGHSDDVSAREEISGANKELTRPRVLPWPTETRPHYIRLFGLQERLRGHLKFANELAVAKRLISYEKELTEKDGVLRNIYHFLKEMDEEIDEIRAARDVAITGHRPKWLEITLEVKSLNRQISEKMPLIEQDLKNRLDVAVIKKTNEALMAARSIRDSLLSLRLDNSQIDIDENGFETITDLTPPPPQTHLLDLNSWQLLTITQKRF